MINNHQNHFNVDVPFIIWKCPQVETSPFSIFISDRQIIHFHTTQISYLQLPVQVDSPGVETEVWSDGH